jgi:hypothetical protein
MARHAAPDVRAGRSAVLAGPGPGRVDSRVLGRRRRRPPPHRRHPGQDRALAPIGHDLTAPAANGRRAEARPWPRPRRQNRDRSGIRTTFAVQFDDGDVRIIRRTTDQPVPSIKGTATADRYLSFLALMSHIRWRGTVADHLAHHRTVQDPPSYRPSAESPFGSETIGSAGSVCRRGLSARSPS